MELRIRKWNGPAATAAPKHRNAELAFINVSTPDEIRDKRNQHKVRRHVMKDIGLSRRRAIVIDEPLLFPMPRSFVPVPAYLGQMRVCHYFQRVFRAIAVFDDEILSLALSDSAPDFSQPFIMDAGTVERQPLQTMTMTKYTSTLGLVRHQLLDSEDMSSHSATVGTIICLAFYDIRVRNLTRWRMHMGGLFAVIKNNGGMKALESFKSLWQALFLADVIGSLVFDERPRFRRPKNFLQAGSSFKTNFADVDRIIDNWSRKYPTFDDLGSVLRPLHKLADQISQAPQSFEHGSQHLLQSLSVLTYDILNKRIYNSPGSTDSLSTLSGGVAVREIIRLTALVFAATVLTLSSGDDLYCPKKYQEPVKRLLIQTQDSDWAGIEELKLWVLAAGALISNEKDKAWIVGQICDLMAAKGLESWGQLVSVLRQTAWIESLVASGQDSLKADIEKAIAERVK